MYAIEIHTNNSNKINDAILAVPQLQKSYQGKSNFFLDFLIKSLKVCSESDNFLALNQCFDLNSVTGDCMFMSSVERFESPTDYCLSCNADDVEVIPSSYPDSEICFDLDISLGSPGCTSVDCPQVFEFECFADKMKEGETLPLEEPITCGSFKQVASKIFSTSLLLKRFQMYKIEDPLYETTENTWMEKNVFRESNHVNCTAQVNPELMIRENSALSEYPNKQKLKEDVEEFLSPCHTWPSTPQCIEDFDDPVNFATLLQCQQEDLDLIHGSLLVQVKGYEKFTLDSVHGFPHLRPFMDLSNEDAKSWCMESSPVISFTDDRIATSHHTIDDFVESLNKDLKLFEEKIPKVTLLSCKSLANLRREVVFTELHYDRARLSEPVLYVTPLMDPVLEALKTLDIIQTENRSMISQVDLSSSNLSKDMQEGLIDPFTDVSILKDANFKSCVVCVEKYIKLDSTKEEALLERSDDLKQDCTLGKVTALRKVAEPEESDLNNQSYFPVSNCPLNTFMLCRNGLFQADTEKEESSSNIDIVDNDVDVIDLETDLSSAKNSQEHTSKIMKVPFTGPYKDIMKNIMEHLSSYYDKVRQYGHIPHNQNMMSISVDQMRFIYKEAEHFYLKRKPSGADGQVHEVDKDILQNYALLLHLKITLDLLIHACLESAITHLSSCVDSDYENCPGSLLHLHEELFKTQIEFMEFDCNHPKFVAVISEINRLSESRSKILVVIQEGLFSLQCALDRILHKVSPLPICSTCGVQSLEKSSGREGITILLEENELKMDILKHFSLILHYDASNLKLKHLCDSIGVPFIGLVSEIPPTSDLITSDNFSMSLLSTPLTAISSTEMTQHKQLVYTLEARYNILILERNYLALGKGLSIYYADLIFGFHHCIILLPLHEMSSKWNLEDFITRLVAVGFQCSFCFILAHGIGGPSRYPLDRIILLNLYKLRASLSNLSRSSLSFRTTYKVIICANEDDVAKSIRSIADEALSQQVSNLTSTPLMSEMTKEEAFLLQLVCFNSYSAQKFLSLWTLDSLFVLQAHDIKQTLPDVSKHFLTMFEQSLLMLKPLLPQMSSVASNISHSPDLSNYKGSDTSEVSDINGDDQIILISSENSKSSNSGNIQAPENYERHVQGDNCLKNDKLSIIYRRENYKGQEQSPMKTIQSSPDYVEELEKIASVTEDEKRSSRKRFATQNVNTEIPKKTYCNSNLPSSLQILSSGVNDDVQFPQNKVYANMNYITKEEKSKDHQSSSKSSLYMGNDCGFFEHSPFTAGNENNIIYTDDNKNSYKYLKMSESKMLLTSNSKKSYPIANEYFNGTYQKDTPQWKKLETAKSTPTASSTLNKYKSIRQKNLFSMIHKSDTSSSFLTLKPHEKKNRNLYGIFSEKICRVKEYCTDTVDKQPAHFDVHSLPAVETKDMDTNSRSVKYLSSQERKKFKRDHEDGDILTEKSLPFKVSRNLRKYIDQKENNCNLRESLTWYRNQTDSYCGESSHITLGKTNQRTRNVTHISSISAVSEKGLKDQRKVFVSNSSLWNSNYTSSKDKAYDNRRHHFITEGQTTFERHSTDEKANMSENKKNSFAKNACNKPLLNAFQRNDSQWLRKHGCVNDDEKPSNRPRQMETLTLPFLTELSMDKDLLYLPQKSDNFDVIIKQSQH